MSKNWEPKEKKDLRDLTNAMRRQIKAIIKKENLQYKKIKKVLEEYKANSMISSSPNKKAYVNGHFEDICFREFEHIETRDDGKNIYSIVIAYINKRKNTLSHLKIFTEENTAELNNIDTAAKGKIIYRVSPFGGASEIINHPSRLHSGKIEYEYTYVDNGENYRIDRAQIVDDVNYSLNYSKKVGNKSVSCGFVRCINGEISYASFDRKDDFRAICELHRSQDILRVSDKCMEHTERSRSLT